MYSSKSLLSPLRRTAQGLKKRDRCGIQENYFTITMTGCSIPAQKKSLTVTAAAALISIAWIPLLHKIMQMYHNAVPFVGIHKLKHQAVSTVTLLLC